MHRPRHVTVWCAGLKGVRFIKHTLQLKRGWNPSPLSAIAIVAVWCALQFITHHLRFVMSCILCSGGLVEGTGNLSCFIQRKVKWKRRHVIVSCNGVSDLRSILSRVLNYALLPFRCFYMTGKLHLSIWDHAEENQVIIISLKFLYWFLSFENYLGWPFFQSLFSDMLKQWLFCNNIL